MAKYKITSQDSGTQSNPLDLVLGTNAGSITEIDLNGFYVSFDNSDEIFEDLEVIKNGTIVNTD